MAIRDRPWQSDAELEQAGLSQGASVRIRFTDPSQPKPMATYGLLLMFVVVFVLELITLNTRGVAAFADIFTIHSIPTPFDWVNRPWSPITATISHDPDNLGHLLFNGLTLYFFGPRIEALLGVRRYLLFFTVAGALSSIAQAILAPGFALGASGALMGLIGITIVLWPKSKIFFFPLPVAIPMWVGGLIFVAIDMLGVFSGSTGIGNFAHLGGMAIGLAYGLSLRPRVATAR